MTQAERTARMGQDSVARLLYQFSVPAILGLVASALYNIVDRIFVGHVVGADGLGAVSLAFPLSVFMIALGSLIGVGSASQLSRDLGEGRIQSAEKALGNALTATLAVSFLIFVGGAWFLDEVTLLMGATEHLFPLTRQYLWIVLWGLPFQMLAFTLNYLIRAEGFPGYAMWTLVIGAVANIFLDWLFIVRIPLGVAGAALGTSIAQVLAACWVGAFYLFRRGNLRFRRAALVPDRAVMKEMLFVGFSPFMTEMFFTVSMMLFNNILAGLGGDLAISAMGIFFSLDNLIYLPVMGIAEGLQPIVGYNYGAGQIDRVKKTILCSGIASFAWFALAFIAAEVFTRRMVMLFNASDSALIDLTVRAMRIGYLGMPFAGMGIVGASLFQSLGKAGKSLFLSLCRQGLFFLPALLILPKLFGLDGVWATFIAVDAGGGLAGSLLVWFEWQLWNRGEDCSPVARQALQHP